MLLNSIEYLGIFWEGAYLVRVKSEGSSVEIYDRLLFPRIWFRRLKGGYSFVSKMVNFDGPMLISTIHSTTCMVEESGNFLEGAPM